MDRVWAVFLTIAFIFPLLPISEAVARELAAAEPALFMPGHDACVEAAANPPIDGKFIKSVASYGAIGDGRSHTIGALRDAKQITPALSASINLVNSVLYKTFKVNDSDEADWVAIQAALVAAKNNRGGTVLIPSGTGDFMLSRSLWVYSNVTLKWLGARFVKAAKSVGGSVISNANPWDRPTAGAYNDHVCNVHIVDPHVDGGGASMPQIYGQNGISFFNGAENIHIRGGILRNNRWCSRACAAAGGDAQGGRAFQFESGVKNVYVDGTKIIGASIAFSSAGGLCAFKNGANCNRSGGFFFPYRPVAPDWPRPKEFARNIAWNVNARNLDIENCGMPFMFGNLLFGHVDSAGVSHYQTELVQKVSVSGFKVKNSGYLLPETLEGGIRSDGAIFNLVGATNIEIIGGTVENAGYHKINSLVRGFGQNIRMAEVTFEGNTDSFIEFASRVGNALYSAAYSSSISMSHIMHIGQTDYLLNLKSVTDASFDPVDHGQILEELISPEFSLNEEQKKLVRVGIRPAGSAGAHIYGYPYLSPQLTVTPVPADRPIQRKTGR